jgi:hypothetical protein
MQPWLIKVSCIVIDGLLQLLQAWNLIAEFSIVKLSRSGRTLILLIIFIFAFKLLIRQRISTFNFI